MTLLFGLKYLGIIIIILPYNTLTIAPKNPAWNLYMYNQTN